MDDLGSPQADLLISQAPAVYLSQLPPSELAEVNIVANAPPTNYPTLKRHILVNGYTRKGKKIVSH